MSDPTTTAPMTAEIPADLDAKFAELRQGIFDGYEAEFRAVPELATGGNVQLAWQRLYVAAMLSVASEIAVDATMTLEQWQAIATESYQRAYSAAPRFG